MSAERFDSHPPDQLACFRQARISRDPRFDGTFFVAVTTTGIFCRPVCPARLPAEHNVLYYTHALQAMAAGFRPCLRGQTVRRNPVPGRVWIPPLNVLSSS